MHTTRAQKIYDILTKNHDRLDIVTLYLEILRLEDLSPNDLSIHSIGATCRAYNHTHLKRTGRQLFRLYPDEKRGYISLCNYNETKYNDAQLEFLTTVLEISI